jgi:O-antigen/teichoic acid export membrane protein
MSITKITINAKSISKLFADKNLTKKASLNAIASALDYGTRLVVGFLVQPIMVSGMGDFYYGIWQILLRLIGYITPAGGRPAQALKMTLANQQMIATDDEKRRYVGSSIIIWLIFLPIMGILGGLLTWFVPYWIKSPAESYFIIRIAAAILVFNLIISNLSTVPASALEGENLGYKRMGLSAFLVVLGGGLTWLAVYLNTGIIGVGVATLLITLLTGMFYLWVMHDFAPWFGVARPSLSDVRKLLGLSWWFLAWNLIMNLMTASDVVILGVLLSVQTVTDYSLSKYAPETLISIVAIVVFGILPGLGGIIGAKNFEKANQVRGEIMAFTWIIVTTLGTVILLWNQAFISLWVGSQHYVGIIPNLLIVIVVMQFILIRNDGNVIDLTLQLKQKVVMGAISVGLSLGIAILLIKWLGLNIIGICLGLIVGRLMLSIGYPTLVGRLLGISFISQIKSSIRPAFVTVVLFSGATFVNSLITKIYFTGVKGWLILGLLIVVSLSLILFSTFYTGLTKYQRSSIIERLQAILSIPKD